MNHPDKRALRGDLGDPEIHAATATVQKWLRAYEQRNFAHLPGQGKPDAVAAVEIKDRAMSMRTLLAAVLTYIPFTAPRREQKRLERERMDWPRHLRQYLAAQTELPCDDGADEPLATRVGPV